MSGSSWPGENELNEIKYTGPTMAGRGPEEVRVVLSPHRTCPLGAHSDHEGGTVSVMIVNEGMLLGFNPSVDTDVKGPVPFSHSLMNQRGVDWPNTYRTCHEILHACSIGTTCFAGSHGKGGLLSSVWRSFQSVRVYLTGWSLMPAGFRNGWQPMKHLHHVYEILLKARGVFGTCLSSAGFRGYPAFRLDQKPASICEAGHCARLK